jgi:hypothetical protein
LFSSLINFLSSVLSRTFDIQCLNSQDYETLLINLKELISVDAGGPAEGGGGGGTLIPTTSFTAPMDNPLKRKMVEEKKKLPVSPKKSVRFIDETEEEVPARRMQQSQSNNNNSSGISTLSDASKGTEVVYVGTDGNLDDLLKRGDDTNDPKIFSQDSYDAAEEKGQVGGNRGGGIARNGSLLRMSSTEAIQIGMVLAEQEKKFGTNMYESLEKRDEPMIQEYVKKGYTTEESILMVFEDKYVHPTVKTPVTPRNPNVLTADSKEFVGRKSPFLPVLSFKQEPSELSPQQKKYTKITSTDALQVGLLLSQQEREFGTNMYESMKPADEAELIRLMATGRSSQQAALEIFQKKFVYRIRSEQEIANPKENGPAGLKVMFFKEVNSLLPFSFLILFFACSLSTDNDSFFCWCSQSIRFQFIPWC